MTEFEEIYSKYFGKVFRYILKLSHDEHIAQDITSQTFFKAMKSLNTFRGDCDIDVWLCQIAKNTYFSHFNKNKNVHSLDEFNYIPDTNKNLEEQLILKDDADNIKQLLHTLPEPYKEVFMWRVFADLSFKQIGQIFQKSENWACVTYHRARNKLKEKELKQNEKSM